MIKDISAEKILETPEFVRKPVDKVCEKIENSDSKRIILSGGRGAGKSVVLESLEKKHLDDERHFIYTGFSTIPIFGHAPDDLFPEQFWKHYYELYFAQKILWHIKGNNYNHGMIYENHFQEVNLLLNDIAMQTTSYINNATYGGVSINRYLAPMELSSQIVDDIKKHLNLKSLSLMIDRFDWTNGRSELVQELLSQYFDLFDQVIVTTDDESLLERKNRKALIEKGYSFINVNYGKNMMVIKSIIRRRIQNHNQNLRRGENRFPEDIITNEIYQSLITKTNGNIKVMLDSMRKLLNHYWFYDESFDIEKHAEQAIDESVENYQKIKEMDACPPKFYL